MNLVKSIDIVASVIAEGTGDPLTDEQRECLSGSLAILLTQPRMSKAEFGALLWIVQFDALPKNAIKLYEWIDDEAKRHGYKDWREAYERMGEGGC